MAPDQPTAPEAPGPISLGMLAPDFEAKTTHGKIKLSDYRGMWVILFSHPGDFTPVCTTEFVEFARKYDEFTRRGVGLIGLSQDSVPSHIAWIKDIQEHLGIGIPFPVIADVNAHVSRLYGMIHPLANAEAPIRSLFIIDPDRIVQMIVHYPRRVGRSTDEVLRLIDALQVVARVEHVGTPAGWHPGDPVVVKEPTTMNAAEERTRSPGELDCKGWYLCMKKL